MLDVILSLIFESMAFLVSFPGSRNFCSSSLFCITPDAVLLRDFPLVHWKAQFMLLIIIIIYRYLSAIILYCRFYKMEKMWLIKTLTVSDCEFGYQYIWKTGLQPACALLVASITRRFCLAIPLLLGIPKVLIEKMIAIFNILTTRYEF